MFFYFSFGVENIINFKGYVHNKREIQLDSSNSPNFSPREVKIKNIGSAVDF